MFRPLKNWMSVLVLFALIAASVVPASALTISFDTEVAPMTILSSTPLPDATNVSLTDQVRVQFSKNVSWGSIGGSFHYAVGGGAVPGNMADIGYESGSHTVTVTMLAPLVGSTEYYLDLSIFGATDGTGGLPNNADNAAYFSHGSGPRLYFTTVENLAPVWMNATSSSGAQLPPYNASPPLIPITAQIVVTASKALDGTTVTAANIKLYKGINSDMSTQVTIDAPTLDGTGKIITVKPSSNLDYGTHYHLELTNVKDTQNNILP